MMRLMPVLSFAALAMLISAEASAVEYPWCAEYSVRGGATNCGFSTLDQCRATVSGIGGFCRENLFYRGPAVGSDVGVRPRVKKRVKHRHDT